MLDIGLAFGAGSPQIERLALGDELLERRSDNIAPTSRCSILA